MFDQIGVCRSCGEKLWLMGNKKVLRVCGCKQFMSQHEIDEEDAQLLEDWNNRNGKKDSDSV